MNKPTQTTIDLSRKLWELGVRKEIQEGDWCIYNNRLVLIIELERKKIRSYADYRIAGYVTKIDCNLLQKRFIPTWTDCDECIEWLRGKGWKVLNIASGGSSVLVRIAKVVGKEVFRKRAESPTLTEALLKAMVEVGKIQKQGGD